MLSKQRVPNTNVGNGDGRLDHNSNLVITQFGSNMIDMDDIAQLGENLNQKCLRKIQFNYDYSLCPGTVNSYDAAGAMYTNPSGVADLTRLGKLTLLSIDCQGQGGSSVTPPIHFQYDLDPNDPANVDYAQVTSYNSGDKYAYIQFGTSTLSKMHLGDIVKLNNGTYGRPGG